MATPYPFRARLLSPAYSQPHSHSSSTSSSSSLSDSNDDSSLLEIQSFTPSIDLTLNQNPVVVGGPRSLNRHSPRRCPDELRLARLRYLHRNDPVPEPRSPPRRNDFPGKPAQGDPKNEDKVKCSPVDGPRWSDAEYHQSLSSAFKPQFPPNLGGVVETRLKDEQSASRPLVGFAHELNWIVELNREKRADYEDCHKEWAELERALVAEANKLRVEFSKTVEDVHVAHHKHRRQRLTRENYRMVKKNHTKHLDKIFHSIRDVAIALSILYMDRAAVAQAVVPRWGENYGKMDLVRI